MQLQQERSLSAVATSTAPDTASAVLTFSQKQLLFWQTFREIPKLGRKGRCEAYAKLRSSFPGNRGD
jgi:hypothetical protein